VGQYKKTPLSNFSLRIWNFLAIWSGSGVRERPASSNLYDLLNEAADPTSFTNSSKVQIPATPAASAAASKATPAGDPFFW